MSMKRRATKFGLKTGLNLDGFQTNFVPSKGQNVTIQSVTMRGRQRLLTGSLSKKQLKASANLPSSSTTAYQSQVQGRQSQHVLVDNSLQRMNLRALFERAKSSTLNERQARLRASSQGNNLVSATALSQIPPRTNVAVLDEYYSSYNTQGQISAIKFAAEFERLADNI